MLSIPVVRDLPIVFVELPMLIELRMLLCRERRSEEKSSANAK
jgi:hypothetical protein